MNPVADLLARSVPILIGGGFVQFLIYLLKRRGDLKAADAVTAKLAAESGGIFVSSAAQSVALSDQVRDTLNRRLQVSEAELAASHAEIETLTRVVARLRLQVDRLQQQVDRLQPPPAAVSP